jgi:hypothetical protein
MARTTARGRLAGGLLTAVLVVALAGCGSGGNGGGSPSATPSASASASPSAGAPAASSSAAEQQVRENWEKFFSPDTPVKDKAKLLENGDQLQLLLQAFSGDDRVGKVKAKVSKVRFTSSTEAAVTYTLSLSGQPVLTDATGTAVLQDNVWKVSVKSLCALVTMDNSGGGGSVPGC